MVIDGYDFKFLYSVGAYLGFQAAKFPQNPKDASERIKTIMGMAVIMSKEYEDSQALYNSNYDPHYLRPEQLRAMTMRDFNALTEEVNKAIEDGQVREVIAEETNKKKENHGKK